MSDGSLRLELFVADVEASASFYERVLGFERERGEGDYVALKRGNARIGIGLAGMLPGSHPLKPRSGERTGVGVEIVLEVDDVHAAYAAVQATGRPISSPIQERPWGLRDFRIIDPDGYYVRVTSVD
jgi:predicted enzyme related to lactoylglutathione lyase